MKPVTSQDKKWTILQRTQGLKHQHAKLQGLGCLPTRSTQSERYSRSPGQHDLSVQIWRLKRPLMAKVWLPNLWVSTIPSIWTCGRPNSDKGARRYGLQNPYCAISPKSDRLFSKAVLGSYLRFWGNHWIPKLEIISWHTIWTPNQENLDEVDFMETKFPSLSRKISYKGRWSTPQGSPRA
jgi:hypothetical protein